MSNDSGTASLPLREKSSHPIPSVSPVYDATKVGRSSVRLTLSARRMPRNSPAASMPIGHCLTPSKQPRVRQIGRLICCVPMQSAQPASRIARCELNRWRRAGERLIASHSLQSPQSISPQESAEFDQRISSHHALCPSESALPIQSLDSVDLSMCRIHCVAVVATGIGALRVSGRCIRMRRCPIP